MNATPDRLVNINGFTDDDVVARELTLEGRPHPYDDIVMDVRKAYRAGMSRYYRAVHSAYASAATVAMIRQVLEQIFTTSVVQCYPDPGWPRDLMIVVQFPQAQD